MLAKRCHNVKPFPPSDDAPARGISRNIPHESARTGESENFVVAQAIFYLLIWRIPPPTRYDKEVK
jgi:hypothetical protein